MSYLIEAIDVVGKQVHYLPRGRSTHRLAAETKSLTRTNIQTLWLVVLVSNSSAHTFLLQIY